MLNKSSAVIGLNLGEILTERGLKVTCKPNTLVGALSASMNGMMFEGSNTFNRDMIPDILVESSVGSYSGTGKTDSGVSGGKKYTESNHDIMMDNYINDLRGLVSGYIGFARSVVNKQVTLMIESVQERLGGYQCREAEDFFKITYFKLHEVYATSLMDDVQGYAGEGDKFYFTRLNLDGGVKNSDLDIIGYLMTGDEAIDSALGSHLKSLGAGFVKNLLVENIPEFSLSVEQALDFNLVNYLFYRNLSLKTDLNLGCGLTEMQTTAARNRDYFGYRLITSYQLFQSLINKGSLLSSSSEMSFSVYMGNPLKITVYEDNFEKMVQEGLTLEVLFGFIASTNSTPSVTLSELKANAAEYASRWSSVRSIYTANIINSRIDVFKQVLINCFDSCVNAEPNDEFEKEFMTHHAGFNQETLKLGYSYIDSLCIGDVDRLEDVVLDLIAKIKYRFTNAYFILKEMKELMASNDKITPMEASLMAASKLVADFLIENTDVVKLA